MTTARPFLRAGIEALVPGAPFLHATRRWREALRAKGEDPYAWHCGGERPTIAPPGFLYAFTDIATSVGYTGGLALALAGTPEGALLPPNAPLIGATTAAVLLGARFAASYRANTQTPSL
jgi:hypothetical protein